MNNTNLSRRQFLHYTAAGVVAASLPRNAAASDTAPPWETHFKTSNATALRVLQFTDVHFFNGITKMPKREAWQRQKTLDEMRRLVDHAKPDLLFVTGDLWHENPDGRGAEFMAYAIEQCAALGVPWAFTWGNHDTLDDYAAGHTMLAGAKGSLYGGEQHDGNYVLTVENTEGDALVHFFCLNTRKEGVHADARRFVAEASETLDQAGPRPMRLAACHIPVKQYETIWENGTASGIIGEKVCFEQEDGASLSVLRDAGIQALFCGHDHVNDYSGVLEGVDLIYGRATGHAGYGGSKVQKGGKLYTLDPARKELEWVSLLPDGTTWKPKPAERIEKWD